MAAYLSAAVSASQLFARSNLSTNYVSQSGSAADRAEYIGLWRVSRARHSRTGAEVSIWEYDKSSGAVRSSHASSAYKGKARALELIGDTMRKDASSITRLRHPCVLEMVEQVEETNKLITFATEPITSSLRTALERQSPSKAGTHPVSADGLDEVDVQKGLASVGKGLQFLHEQARLVHGNLTPDAIVINVKGDWKLCGFGLSVSIASDNAAQYALPAYDDRLPSVLQRNLDYLAPELALDAQMGPKSDMYALGCILFATCTAGAPPVRNLNSVTRLRQNANEVHRLRSTWSGLDAAIQDVLGQLLTRSPTSRLTAAAFQTSGYFNSLLVSTLRFLDRDSFNAKAKEEQISFMRGLLTILPRFSDKTIRQRILPSLLEETRKTSLIPVLLPNIFYIANRMTAEEFQSDCLPLLMPLFTARDASQTSLLAFLDHLEMLQSKCTPEVFRSDIMPILYGCLQSEDVTVLQQALRIVPKLSESLEYTEVKQVLFPRITTVFSKTTLLAVKVATLICFHAMVTTLDKWTLTERLVPLLAKIKTKEPAVIVATLAVYEKMGDKCEINSVATLILPQLWAMSVNPQLSTDQFRNFLRVITRLGERVEKEHLQVLLESRPNEQSSLHQNGTDNAIFASSSGELDFETLVRGMASTSLSNGKSVAADPWDTPTDSPNLSSPATGVPNYFAPTPMVPQMSQERIAPTRQTASRTARTTATRPLATRLPASSFDTSSFDTVQPDVNKDSFSNLAYVPPKIAAQSPWATVHSPRESMSFPIAAPAPAPAPQNGLLKPMQPKKVIVESNTSSWADLDPFATNNEWAS
ncbi:uncharacterized protein L969DRAFT_15672 [Mixia osmundae IAM 14324]|uniref:uncharacterized protein n=1 Tax=Mixia osmundae (strain CBS 9802 / IAM 14324 / JCM 22182 / KY 12970) TaxID=764103 RepID=UPI0004A550D8|nr:uncharacterized protein L969DRAFT_15672 [Mixia osmundae IAM 14324]KEI41649.1 hypothetical protein L969DRAFT_15672 [Mixia osmundae IAM 14324]